MRVATGALTGVLVLTACAAPGATAPSPSAVPASATAEVATARAAPPSSAATAARATAPASARLACHPAPAAPAPYSLTSVPFSVEVRPLVATVGCVETFTITVRPSTPVPSVTITTPSGQRVALTQSSANVFTTTITSAQVLGRWTAAQGNHVTFELATGESGEPFFQMGVRHAGVPDAAVTKLAPDAQATARVLNLHDPAPSARFELSKYARRLYALYGDDFDIINIVQARATRTNSHHVNVKNAVQGIGLQPHDATAGYGSGGRLLGINNITIFSNFDMAGHTFAHETGHQWINHLRAAPLGPNSGSHWPYSTLATGVMGFSIGGGEGGSFPYRVESAGGTQYRLTLTTPGAATTFRDLDLYLMGLLPPDRVQPETVFTDQRASAMRSGAVLEGVPVTVQDVIAAHGPRVPAAGSTRTELAVATVVVSHDRLLEPQEMAWFEHLAARGELREPVLVSAGRLVNMQNPWYVATRQLGTIDARMRPKGP